MQRRVKRPAEYDDLLNSLREQIFDTYKDVLIFAACYGLKKNYRKTFSKSGEPISISIFDNERDRMIFNIIAMKETNFDANIMSNEQFDDKITMFEEYACGGLALLSNLIDPKDDRLVDALLEVISKNGVSILDEIGDIGHLADI